jgi:hypothetical protein
MHDSPYFLQKFQTARTSILLVTDVLRLPTPQGVTAWAERVFEQAYYLHPDFTTFAARRGPSIRQQ